MTKKIDLNKYSEFVDGVTSDPSKDLEVLIARMRKLQDAGANVPRLLTAGIGLASEGGEFDEIVKKIIFQGKEYSAENVFHMKRELGDIIWYWVQACMALGLDPNEVVAENVNKLESRFPGGQFDAWYSENRKDNDI
jgi:NTP pyrophosphatase (non-canonical NTP hydrolase)